MCDFKRLNKWIKEKTKIDYEHINIIFLGMTFLTFVLSEIIISAVNNATEIIPNWVHYLFSLTFGLILFLCAFFFPIFTLHLIAAGLAVIIQHYRSDGFVFIRRW